MISDFELLSDKVALLAELAHALRIENAGLRHDVVALTEKTTKFELLTELSQTLRIDNEGLRAEVAALTAKNLDLQQRMEQAHERVTALLEHLPQAPVTDEEAA